MNSPRFIERWKRKETDVCIITADGGHRVYFPYGPLRGYVLPKPAFESIIITSRLWFRLAAFASFIAIGVVGKLLGISMDVLFFIGLLDRVGYYYRNKRITRKLVQLPQPLGMKVFAQGRGPEEMAKQAGMFGLMAIMFGLLMFVVPARVLFGAIALLLAYDAFVWAKASRTLTVDDVPANELVHGDCASAAILKSEPSSVIL